MQHGNHRTLSQPQPPVSIRRLATRLARLAPLPLLALAIAQPARAAPARVFPFPVHERTLANGLRVFVVEYDSPGLVAYHTVVRTGSRNEVEPGKTGFAHFFEHMMFRGTPRHPQQAYNEALKAMGADSNAFTSDDMTVYHILAGKDALPRIVDLEADRFQNLSYSQADFQKEARAVLGEYNKGASNPLQKMIEALFDNAFTTHTYKHTTIGFLADIERMPQQFDYARAFFDRYYRPDNVVLLIVGDVVPNDVFSLVERHYGGWKKGPSRPEVPAEPPQGEEKRVKLDWPEPTLPMLLMGFHVPAFSTGDIDVPALSMLSSLLFSERSPLYRRLVLEEQKVETIGAWNDFHVDPHLFLVYARVKAPSDLAYVESVIHDEIAKMAREGVAPVALAEELSHARYAFAHGLGTVAGTARVAAEFIAITLGLTAIDGYFTRAARVTAADIKRVAAQYFQPKNRTVVTLTGAAEAPAAGPQGDKR